MPARELWLDGWTAGEGVTAASVDRHLLQTSPRWKTGTAVCMEHDGEIRAGHGGSDAES